MCLHLLSWQIAIIGCVQMQEGLVVNSPSAVGRQWPSRGEMCSKGSKEPRGLSPTAPNWGCWADFPNAAPRKMPLTCFHIWLGSENNLAALRATNSNKHPAEAQLNPISLACRPTNELWPAPYLSAPKGWCASQECSGRGQPSPGGHDPIQIIPSAQGFFWQKTLTAYGMGHCWAVPNRPHLGWILENTGVSPHVHTAGFWHFHYARDSHSPCSKYWLDMLLSEK